MSNKTHIDSSLYFSSNLYRIGYEHATLDAQLSYIDGIKQACDFFEKLIQKSASDGNIQIKDTRVIEEIIQKYLNDETSVKDNNLTIDRKE